MKRIMTLFVLFLVATWLLPPGELLGVEDWFSQGLSLLESRRYEDAIKAFSISIQKTSHVSEAYNHRGIAWFHKGDYDQAIADYTKALEINPLYAEAYCSRGIAWFHKGDYDQAIADYTKALEINPLYAEAYHQLALVLTICPDERYLDITLALKLAQKAVALNPEANFLDTLAAVYAEVGKLEDAIIAQERAVRLLEKEGTKEKLDEYIERMESYTERKRLREEYIAQLQKNENDALKRPRAKVEQQMPHQIDKGRATANKQGFYPYTIQICSLRHRERAILVATKLREKGDPAFTCHAYIPGKGDWYRVFMGYYGTIEDARNAALELKKRKFRYANVVKKPYAIQVGASDSDQEIRKLEADLSSEGYLAYTIPDTQGTSKTRILIGAFRRAKEASILMKKLQEEGFKPKVVLR
jgi:tetratricopeptide (TPR) repeat protein